MRISILFISLFLLLLISCGGNKKATDEATNDNAIMEQTDPDSVITEKYWKLVKLEGQDVEMVENQLREIFFTLKEIDNTLTGFAGCNAISGEFLLDEGNRIQFNNMSITLKACPDVNINESEFMEVFEMADNYTIHNDTLALNVGRRAPLAVFEAVYF